MKFIVSSTTLLKQLQNISGVVNNNSSLPILTNFLFDIDANEMTVYASDLETTLSTKIPVKAEEKGKVAIPARILIDTLKELAEMPLSFLIDNKLRLVIT
jgi:DNA polymerase-3 subunit beta